MTIRYPDWKTLVVLVGVAAAGLLAQGQDRDLVRPLYVDLDQDGKPELISSEKFAETEEDGDFYQLRVSDNLGNLIWEGPKVTDPDNPLVFGSWHFGVSLPELAGDIDGDGSVELVAPEPQSDVSPTYFRVLRWVGGRFFVAKKPAGSLLESPVGSGRFPWKKSEEWSGTWISSFEAVVPDGSIRVQVYEYKDGSAPRTGEAIVEVVPGGYQLKQWLIPLTGMSDEEPESEFTGKTMPVAKTGGTIYRARLSAGDHSNSRGKRLTGVGDILRQDRANFHKGIGDNEDGGELVFSTVAARESMDSRTPVPVGAGSKSSWQRAIVNGTPLVEVEVTNTALRVKIIEP